MKEKLKTLFVITLEVIIGLLGILGIILFLSAFVCVWTDIVTDYFNRGVKI